MYIGCMITYRFSTEQRDGRYFIFRDGEKLGAKYGYDTERDALEAIEQTKRWDSLVGGA